MTSLLTRIESGQGESMISDREMLALDRVWAAMGTSAWVPRDPNSPLIDKAVDEGWMRRLDGRVMFEMIKDGMLQFTGKGAEVFRQRAEARALESSP